MMAVESEIWRSELPTPKKRRLRSDEGVLDDAEIPTPAKRTPSRKLRSPSPSLSTPCAAYETINHDHIKILRKIQGKKLSFDVVPDQNWNPRDGEKMRMVKEALHVSTAPSTVVCREDEQKAVFDFCRGCIEREKSGSLYICGCPGTGKSLSINKVKDLLIDWSREGGYLEPNVLNLCCTSLTKTSDIFSKVLDKVEPQMKRNGCASPLQHLQAMFSTNSSSGSKMILLIIDEIDYLITKDRMVLHDLFLLTTFPFSRCILIGIANAMDLADRFLPKLQSLDCKPMVVSFNTYSNDQILNILRERLKAFPYHVFHCQALELCARKVAAVSGDMRKALSVCSSALEILEAELRDANSFTNSSPMEATDSKQKQDIDVVRIDHMATALSKAFRSPIVDIIRSLPQHQQVILCSAVKLFRGRKKDATILELNKSYMEVCKSELISSVGVLELSNMCTVLSDQGLLKFSRVRDEKSSKVALKVDPVDVVFSLQGIRFFRNCLK